MRRLYKEKINIAGGFMDVAIYPVFASSPKRKKRAKPTSEVMAKLNERNSKKRLTRLIHANFTEKDIALHLTYNEDEFPSDQEEALKDVQKYLRRLKRLYSASNCEFKYVWVCEKGEKSKRVHHHLIINTIKMGAEALSRTAERLNLADGAGLREVVEGLWDKGYANTKRLRFGENGVEGLSHYMTKQKLFFKRFNTSRNLAKPVEIEKQERIWHKDLAYAETVRDFSRIEALYPGYKIASEPVATINEVNGGYYFTMTLKKIE